MPNPAFLTNLSRQKPYLWLSDFNNGNRKTYNQLRNKNAFNILFEGATGSGKTSLMDFCLETGMIYHGIKPYVLWV